MKVTIELEDGPESMMALHLMQNHVAADGLEGYFQQLLNEQVLLHPDYRHCPNPECAEQVYPACTTTPQKRTGKPEWWHSVTTSPVKHCPECGTATVTYKAFLEQLDGCEKYAAHMLARLAVEREIPARKYREFEVFEASRPACA